MQKPFERKKSHYSQCNKQLKTEYCTSLSTPIMPNLLPGSYLSCFTSPFSSLPFSSPSLIIVTFLPPYIISNQPPFFKVNLQYNEKFHYLFYSPLSSNAQGSGERCVVHHPNLNTSSRHFPKQKGISLDMNNASVLDAKMSIVGSCFK